MSHWTIIRYKRGELRGQFVPLSELHVSSEREARTELADLAHQLIVEEDHEVKFTRGDDWMNLHDYSGGMLWQARRRERCDD